MNDENLPARNSIMSRLRRAWNVLTNNTTPINENIPSKQEIENLETLKEQLETLKNALAEKEATLNAREADLDAREADLDAREAAMSSIDPNTIEQSHSPEDLHKQEYPQKAVAKDIRAEDIRDGAKQVLITRLQELQNEIQHFEDNLPLGADPLSPQQQVKLQELKAKFLSTLAVYKETLNPQELSSCTIGDKQMPLDSLMQQLPQLFEFVSPATEKNMTELQFKKLKLLGGTAQYSIFSKTQFEALDQISLAGTQEYKNLLDQLYDIGFIQGESRDQTDYDLTRYGHEGFEWLLENYCGTNFPDKVLFGKTRDYTPLKNFTLLRTPSKDEATLSPSSPVAENTDTTLQTLSDAER